MTIFPRSSLVSIPSKMRLDGTCQVSLRIDADTHADDIICQKEIYGERLLEFQISSDLLRKSELIEALAGSRVTAVATDGDILPEDGRIVERLRNLQLTVIVLPDQHVLRNLNLLASLRIPSRINLSIPIVGEDPLRRAVDFYLHNPLVAIPIEPFHSLLGHIAHQRGPTLWEIGGEVVPTRVYLTKEMKVTLSKRWAEKGWFYGSLEDYWEDLTLSELFTRLSSFRKVLYRSQHPCIYCENLEICGGFIKAIEPEQTCNQWQEVFTSLRQAVVTAKKLSGKSKTVSIGKTRRISLSPDLIQLEKDGQLLLTDGTQVKPLLIKGNIETIKRYLKKCKLCNTEEDLSRTSEDRIFFQTLTKYGLLRYQSENDGGLALNSCSHDFFQVKDLYGALPKEQCITLSLLLSQYCNLGCHYCLAGAESYRKSNLLQMPEKVALSAVEKVLETVPQGGMLKIVFFGGEPMLNWPVAKKVISFCENDLRPKYPDKNWNYHLSTNLTLLPEDFIDWAKRFHISFRVTLDGPEHVHNKMRPGLDPALNSYQRTVSNLKKLMVAGIKPDFRTTVTSHNIDYMEETAKLHKELNGESSGFVPLIPINSDELILPAEWYPNLLDFTDNLFAIIESGIWPYKELTPVSDIAEWLSPSRIVRPGCDAHLGATPAVDVNGNVYACVYLVGIDRYLIGNIYDQDYPQQGPLERMSCLVHARSKQACIKCYYRYICKGGCALDQYSIRENPNAGSAAFRYARDRNCVVIKSIVNYLLWKIADQDGMSDTAYN